MNKEQNEVNTELKCLRYNAPVLTKVKKSGANLFFHILSGLCDPSYVTKVS